MSICSAEISTQELFERLRPSKGLRQVDLKLRADGKYTVMVSEIDGESSIAHSSLYLVSGDEISIENLGRVEEIVRNKEPMVEYIILQDKLFAYAPINPSWVLQDSKSTLEFAKAALRNVIPGESDSLSILTASAREEARGAVKHKDVSSIVMQAVQLKQALGPGARKNITFKFNEHDVDLEYSVGSDGFLESALSQYRNSGKVFSYIKNSPSENIKIKVPDKVGSDDEFAIQGIRTDDSKKKARLGIGFRKAADGWIVADILEGFPVASMGFQIDDLVTHVNNLETKGLQLYELLNILDDEKRVKITGVHPDGKRFELIVPLKEK